MNRMAIRENKHYSNPVVHCCLLCPTDCDLVEYFHSKAYRKCIKVFDSPGGATDWGWELISGTSDNEGWVCPSCMAFMNSTP